MRLILSSCDFRNDNSRRFILKHLPKPIEQCRLLFIPNEKSSPDRLHSDMYSIRMQRHGFSKENIFVFDAARPQRFLGLDLDVIYVSGGNTFKMLDMLRKCRFDHALIEYIRSGVVYIGGSAGAHLVSSDVSHLTRYDPPPDGMSDFRGLGLFDGILLCHFTEERESHERELRAERKYTLYVLTDDDSILIEG